MARSLQDILAHTDGLSKRFRNPATALKGEQDPDALLTLLRAVEARAHAERAIVEAVREARRRGCSWRTIGSIIGTSGEAARQRYGPRSGRSA